MNARISVAEQYAILVVDLNGLKRVNDTLGHEAGEQMILTLSEVLHNSLPSSSVICCWGGDEFTALLTGVNRERLDQHMQMLFIEGDQYNLGHPELPCPRSIRAYPKPSWRAKICTATSNCGTQTIGQKDEGS